jgi:hypothetical protein
MKVWLARAGGRGQDEETALEQGRAIIGYEKVPDLAGAKTKEQMLELCRAAYPEDSEAKALFRAPDGARGHRGSATQEPSPNSTRPGEWTLLVY